MGGVFKMTSIRLDVHPKDLISKIVYDLPTHLFESEVTTFCDPAMGSGTFLKYIAQRLREYNHSSDNIVNRLYGAERSDMYLKRAKDLWGTDNFVIIRNVQDFQRFLMKFDAVVTNPPFQSDKQNGAGTGSGSGAICVDFVKGSHSILKEGGICSMITPSGIVTGSKDKNRYLVGENAIFSLDYLDFDIDHYFDIGQDVCRWMGRKSNKNCLTSINDGRSIDLRTKQYLVQDKMLSEIVDSLVSYNKAPKLSLSMKGLYHFDGIQTQLKKEGVSNFRELARDKSKDKTETNPYPVMFNGKTFYMRVKPKSYKSPSILIPQLTNPKTFKFKVYENMGSNQSVYRMEFNTREEAQNVADIFNNPLYLWIINTLRIDGRVNKTYLNTLPICPLEDVLSEDQLKYLKSKVPSEK